jgi:hypothetical protein
VGVGSSILIFTAFRSRETIAGTSSNRLGPVAYLTVGVIAVCIAIVMTSRRGRALFARDRPTPPRPRRRPRPGSATAARTRARAERSLSDGSLVVAGLVGAVLAVPGPFDVLALGRLARNGYGLFAAVGAMLVFALIKFVLIEVPIASYAIDADTTADRVGRFSEWMKANKLAGVAAVVGLFGVVLVVRGISRLG